MSIHNEIEFENEICDYLAANGWLYVEKDAVDYDRKLALFPADVLAWVQETQPDVWESLTKKHGDSAGQHCPPYPKRNGNHKAVHHRRVACSTDR